VRIAVVIPALHEARHLPEAIRSARAPGVEVVVVDGGSGDATRERALAAGARVVASAAGRARQLQTGVEATDAETLLFLHADTTLPRGFAGTVEECLRDPAVAGGAFAFRFAGPEAMRSGIGLRLVEWGARVRSHRFGLPYGDQALFVRRQVLTALGGIPQVPVMEDLELVLAIRRAGRLALLPDAVATSARRYREGGVLATVLRNALALGAFALGFDRARLAAWMRR
jgi:rSAM/selenodomain-associated transferase 2